MVKIKKPTDLLIRENAIRLLWELYLITKNKKVCSGYKIAKLVGIDHAHAFDYMDRWKEWGLLEEKTVENGKRTQHYFSLNPKFFKLKDDSVSFEIDGIEISLKKRV